ncbi:hypothetical protein BT63DRAFT_296984 [Microthyrium microscopicum]|uniref:F-box domain-containing protein n=1 Tax=Microthyrium microscopicum TaxID=703497 RepID=A0A6A6U9R5_9PEZI|nr:hypothetical protein BT63DRAFT_296984 [Microthyrium microscopicum]
MLLRMGTQLRPSSREPKPMSVLGSDGVYETVDPDELPHSILRRPLELWTGLLAAAPETWGKDSETPVVVYSREQVEGLIVNEQRRWALPDKVDEPRPLELKGSEGESTTTSLVPSDMLPKNKKRNLNWNTLHLSIHAINPITRAKTILSRRKPEQQQEQQPEQQPEQRPVPSPCHLLRMLPLELIILIDDFLSFEDQFAFRLTSLALYRSLSPLTVNCSYHPATRRSIAIFARTHPTILYPAMEASHRLILPSTPGRHTHLYYCNRCELPHHYHAFPPGDKLFYTASTASTRTCRPLDLCPHVSITLARLQSEAANLWSRRPKVSIGVCSHTLRHNYPCFEASVDRGRLQVRNNHVVDARHYHTRTRLQRARAYGAIVRELAFFFEWSVACPHMRSSCWTELCVVARAVIVAVAERRVKGVEPVIRGEEKAHRGMNCRRARQCECDGRDATRKTHSWLRSDGGIDGRCGWNRYYETAKCHCTLVWRIVESGGRMDVVFNLHRKMPLAASTGCTEWLREISSTTK